MVSISLCSCNMVVDMIVPMVMTLLGRITDVSAVQDSKALLPKIRVRLIKE